MSSGSADTARAGASGRISKDPDVRRVEIMAAAMQLFLTVGYKRTSVQTITEKVGVAKGLFYHYFDSKTDLLDKITRWQADIFFENSPKHASEMEGDALDKLRATIGRIVQWKFEDLKSLIATYLQVMYSPENAPFRIAMTNEYTYRMVDLFAEIIEEGIDEGLCDVEDSEMAARLVFSMWVGSSERLVDLMLGLPEEPQNIELLLGHIRGWEAGVERLLGIAQGTLDLYDYGFLREALTDVALPEGGGR